MSRRMWRILTAIVLLNVIAAVVETGAVVVAWAILADSLRGEL